MGFLVRGATILLSFGVMASALLSPLRQPPKHGPALPRQQSSGTRRGVQQLDRATPTTIMRATGFAMGEADLLLLRRKLEAQMERAARIRCPFFRRRATDLIEAAGVVLAFLLARHKSLDFTPPKATGPKTVGLSAAAVMAIVVSDFTDRRYYVTGHLTKEIYSDACLFVRRARSDSHAPPSLLTHARTPATPP
jgi:hypothetical protein